MPVVGIAMVRDEMDVIDGVIRHMNQQVDLLIVADNLSTDGTGPVLRDLRDELGHMLLVDDTDPAYRQSEKMTILAGLAANMFRSDVDVWVVPFDADEIWTAADGQRLRDVLPTLDAPIAVARLTNHFRTFDDAPDRDPFRSMVWCEGGPQELVKVAFRWEPDAVIWQGNHGVTLPSGGDSAAVLDVRHFPVRSPEQLISKARNGAAAYAAAPDLPEDMGMHWKHWGAMTDDQLREAYHQWWVYPDPNREGLVRRPAPYRTWDESSTGEC